MEGEDFFLFCSWLASGMQEAVSEYLLGECTGQLPHPSVHVTQQCKCLILRRREELKGQPGYQTTSLPPGGFVQNHLTLYFVLFFFSFLSRISRESAQ